VADGTALAPRPPRRRSTSSSITPGEPIMSARLASLTSPASPDAPPAPPTAPDASLRRAPTAPPIGEAARARAALARSPLLRSLPISAVEDLTGRVAWRKVDAGETVLAQEEAARAMYVIASGRIKVALASASGREVTLAILRAGEVFGEVALL